MLAEILYVVRNWMVASIVALVIYYLIRHVLLVFSLPPGPMPFPIIGNLIQLLGSDNSPKTVMSRLAAKHKNMYTLWLGPKPTIVVCNWELCKEALITKKNDFSGRIGRKSVIIFLEGKKDITFTDYSPHWETLRKVLHSAVRKYSISETLPTLSADIVDECADLMLKETGPFDPDNFMYLIMYNLLVSSAFGERFAMNDPEFLSLKQSNEELNRSFGNGLPSDILPFLSIFCRAREKAILDVASKIRGMIGRKYKEHKESYMKASPSTRGDVRNFIDALLLAQEEAEVEDKNTLEYLTDENLIMVTFDFFMASIDTTRVLIMWIILLISNHPKIQEKMQKEIDDVIGTTVPCQENRLSCPYTYSVISETLRWMPPIDFTLEHKALRETELGGYKISPGTSCLFYFKNSHFDESHWTEPQEFKPERFLDSNGRYINSRLSGFMPFGLGRRACPGEKLAITNVFLVITRLLQKCSLSLEKGPGSVSLETVTDSIFNFPKKFSLIVKKAEASK